MSVFGLLDPAPLRARVTGRSYWQLRMTDGRIVNEWEVDWSLAPTRGRQALRLVCPNGQIAQLGNTKEADGRLFQLKAGTISAGAGKRTDAHIIGIIHGTDGQATLAIWEYGPERLITCEDNVFDLQYRNIGRLSADVLGIRPD